MDAVWFPRALSSASEGSADECDGQAWDGSEGGAVVGSLPRAQGSACTGDAARLELRRDSPVPAVCARSTAGTGRRVGPGADRGSPRVRVVSQPGKSDRRHETASLPPTSLQICRSLVANMPTAQPQICRSSNSRGARFSAPGSPLPVASDAAREWRATQDEAST